MKPFEEDEEYEYLDEKQVKKLISRLVFEIQKLEQSDVEGKHAISESLSNLKIYKEAFNKKPAEA